MDKFIIKGGNKLYGEIEIQGSKNSALPIFAASILNDEEVTINNVPELSDVNNMLKIMESIGIKIKKNQKKVIIDPSGLFTYKIDNVLAKELRSSVFLLGAVLSKFKYVILSYPGGCDIGLRPIDIHIKALKELGAEIEEKGGFVYCDGTKMRAGEIYLDYPSVGATENIILASIKGDGTTIIHNAAREPEIVELQRFVNKMGGKVSGAGTDIIKVTGVKELLKTDYTIGPDRIVAGTYFISVLMTGGEVFLKGININDIYPIFGKSTKNSCKIDNKNGIICVKSEGKIDSVDKISTQPYPGFPTDLQAPFMALENISKGTCVLTENIFENRFRHVPEMRKMGAQIIVKDRTAVIKGVSRLVGAEVFAQDLRGGASLVLSGLVAEGITVVNDIHHIDRGYENMESVLKKVGANILRI